MKICPKCNEKFESGKFCKFCGTALVEEEQELHCSNCGTKVEAENKDSKFEIEFNENESKRNAFLKNIEEKKSKEKSVLKDAFNLIFGEDSTDEDKEKALEMTEDVVCYSEEKKLVYECVEYARKNKDFEDAFYWVKKAVKEDDSKLLGDCYRRGWGVHEDINEAISYYKKAAENNNADALFSLGEIYLNGEEGITKDSQHAYQYFKLSAKNGNKKIISWLNDELKLNPKNDKALDLLGDCYRNGWTVQTDINEAISYYKKAAENNNADALSSLGEIYLNYGEIQKDKQKAYQYFKESAEYGNGKAAWLMGNNYRDGIYCEKDLEEAFDWYDRSSDAGFNEGMYDLGMCYLYGFGCEKDEESGMELINEAAEEGSENAQKFLEDNGK